jgi:cytochrome c-type biogenesis protein CcmH/NrfF
VPSAPGGPSGARAIRAPRPLAAELTSPRHPSLARGKAARGSRVFLLALVLATSGAIAATQRELEESLTCQCGCGLTVHSCNHLQCQSGEPMKKEIAERLAAGEDTATILAAFRARYGEKILSAPTFHGFNWFAWLTPFALLFLGALSLTRVLRRWTRETPVPAPPVATPADDALRRRLERELADLDREP